MDRNQFDALHTSCVDAFKSYAAEADVTATMLAACTADPLPFPERLKIALQEKTEDTAHIVYLDTKRLLHEAARLGYAFSD